MLNYKTGVVGAGRVGAGMATLMAGHGCEVTIVGLDEDDLRRCRGILEGNLDELVQQGLATEKNRAAILRRFTLTTDTQALKDCIFVLEAAFEDEKIKKGISLKAQGYSDEQIITKLSRMEAKVEKNEEPVKPVQPVILNNSNEENQNSTEMVVKEETAPEIIPQGKSFTLDVSSQTLQMLAEAVAKKISDDITNSDMATRLIEAGGYKRDNEILAKQVKELLEHNKELSQRIEQLESHASKSFWARFRSKR